MEMIVNLVFLKQFICSSRAVLQSTSFHQLTLYDLHYPILNTYFNIMSRLLFTCEIPCLFISLMKIGRHTVVGKIVSLLRPFSAKFIKN